MQMTKWLDGGFRKIVFGFVSRPTDDPQLTCDDCGHVLSGGCWVAEAPGFGAQGILVVCPQCYIDRGQMSSPDGFGILDPPSRLSQEDIEFIKSQGFSVTEQACDHNWPTRERNGQQICLGCRSVVKL